MTTTSAVGAIGFFEEPAGERPDAHRLEIAGQHRPHRAREVGAGVRLGEAVMCRLP